MMSILSKEFGTISFLAVILCAGSAHATGKCDSDLGDGNGVQNPPAPIYGAYEIHELPAFFHGVTKERFRRQYIEIDGQKVVYNLGYPGDPDSDRRAEDLKRTLGADAKIVDNSEGIGLENSVSVNCHGYTMKNLNLEFLPERVWIRASVRDSTFGLSPFNVLLRKFFEKVKEFGLSELSLIEGDLSLRPYDVLVFRDKKDLAQHSGFLLGQTGHLRLRSKFVDLFTADTSPSVIANEYEVTRVEVWRRKSVGE